MSKKLIHAFFNDDDILLSAVKSIKEHNYKIKEIYTPFPVHGLDKIAGIPHTRLAITAFFYGLVGISFAIWMINNIMIVDWPRNIGGKPNFTFIENLPSFIPIFFELTVFFAAHLMVITFYLRSKLWPYKKHENPDPRTTDDLFLAVLEIVEFEEEGVKNLLNEKGAIEITSKEIS